MTVGHAHSHSHDEPPQVSARTQRRLFLTVIPFLIGTVIGLIVLWPSGSGVDLPGAVGPEARQFVGVVTGVDSAPCADVPGQEGFTCALVDVRLEEGPDEGSSITLDMAGSPGGRQAERGDRVIVALTTEDVPGQEYFFVDYERRSALVVLAVLFAIVVVALSRWRGLMALLGLGISLALLIVFVLPAILAGSSPLAVAIVGGAAIMFVTLYLAHGFNARTTTAVLGTLISLTLTGVLALAFVEAARFTGFASEEASFLQISAQQVNLQGLLLGGIIIGTLGVLDDVTVTQASAVWELRIANPRYTSWELYTSALRIGRDHIASTVNTLVLAYAGASLPLLVLFTLANRSLGDVITSELVAEEVVRTLVGSVGLVASVPITTGLAAVAATKEDAATAIKAKRSQEDFKRPRAEEKWRG